MEKIALGRYFLTIILIIIKFTGWTNAQTHFEQSTEKMEGQNIRKETSYSDTNRPMVIPGQMVITVGQEEGDLRGNDDKVLQAALDYLSRFKDGVLQILPGEYFMRNSLRLHSHIIIRGSGEQTILKKTASVTTKLKRDSDWYEYRIQVENPAGFTLGCGIMLLAEPPGGTLDVFRGTVIGIDRDVLTLDKRTDKNFWLERNAKASTTFPVIIGENVHDVKIENIVLDGNRHKNENISGNYAGGVFIQHCDRITFRNVTARNYNGDGFSFQVCDDVVFENCRSIGNADLGFHPGSGSQRPVFRNCISARNSQGIHFCWGVSDGLVENCIFSDNEKYGISIGHRDTDNRIINSKIERNKEVGVIFREELVEFRGPHRNILEGNLIADNGFETDGCGIDIQSETHDIEILNNTIVDSGKGMQKIGIRIGPKAQRIKLEGNKFIGLKKNIQRDKNS